MKYWQVYWKLFIKLFSSILYFGKFRSNTTAYEENESKNPWTGAPLSCFLRGQTVQDQVSLKGLRKLSSTSVYETLPLLRMDLNYCYLSRPKKEWTYLVLKNKFVVLHKDWLKDQCSYQCFYLFQEEAFTTRKNENKKIFEFPLLFSQKGQQEQVSNCFPTKC